MDRSKALAVLGLPSTAKHTEIRDAYRDLAKVWHPDRFTDDPRLHAKAEETLKQINIAYRTLQSESPLLSPTIHARSAEAGPSGSQASNASQEQDPSPVPHWTGRTRRSRRSRRKKGSAIAAYLSLAAIVSSTGLLVGGWNSQRGISSGMAAIDIAVILTALVVFAFNARRFIAGFQK